VPQAVPEIVFSSFPALIDQLHREGLVNDADRDKLLVYRRSPEQSRWHLFEVIEACRMRDNRNPRRLLDGEALARWYADRTGQPFYHIDPLKIRVQSVTAVMGFNFARTHQILCVESHRDHVIVAHCNLEHQGWIEDLQQGVRRDIRTVVADPAKIRRYGIEFYQLSRSLQNQDDTSQGLVRVSNFEQLLELKKTDNIDANDQHIVNVVDWLLRYAFEQRASDIHIEPRRDKGFVRFRIDGMLHTVCDFPLFVTVAVISRLKILGRMNVAEKRKPQDGRLKTRSGQGNEVELRPH
jgi:general secretion pathway protein E